MIVLVARQAFNARLDMYLWTQMICENIILSHTESVTCSSYEFLQLLLFSCILMQLRMHKGKHKALWVDTTDCSACDGILFL